MKNIKLILKKYKRFELQNIDYLEYEPHLKTQVILGTNGSGKSSLIKELSPLPGLANDFNKGGMKKISFTHRGKSYELTSDFSPEATRYFFEVDGVNLNPGYTQTVYRELCLEHFNYTVDIHNLLTGRTKFRRMSVAERRSWFMKINQTDYKYATDYYAALKEKLREKQTELKLSNARLIQEAEKLLSPADEERVKNEIVEYKQHLRSLLESRKPHLSAYNDKLNQVNQKTVLLESTLSALERFLIAADTEGPLLTIEASEARSVLLQTTLQINQKEIVDRSEEIDKIQTAIRLLSDTSGTSVEEIDRTILETEEQIDSLQSRVKYPLAYEDVEAAIAAYQSVQEELSGLLQELTTLRRRDYRQEEIEQFHRTTARLDQELKEATRLSEDYFLQKRQLEELKKQKEMECPSCHHHWHYGYNEAVYQNVCKHHVALNETIVKIKNKQDEIAHELKQFAYLNELLSRYSRMTHYLAALEPLWSYVASKNYLRENPEALSNQLNGILFDLNTLRAIRQLRDQITEKMRIRKVLIDTQNLDKAKLERILEEENTALNAVQARQRNCHNELSDLKRQIALVTNIQRCQLDIRGAISTRDLAIRLLVEDNVTSVLDDIVHGLQLKISIAERSISQSEVLQANIQQLKLNIQQLEKEIELLILSEKALSPKEGLIAKGTMGFINHFIKQMNQFISNIWLYPLELVPMVPDEDDAVDLDYKFMVRVNNGATIIPDISLCSAGMQEVIDLAFVATSMSYLGLSDFPIFLDEFAIALDVAHRHSAYKAIDLLIASSNYTYIFIVSHYQDGYSALASAEILVLCDSNIEIPNDLAYNKHAILR